MTVFDDIDRPDTGYHPHDEGDFSYINRSGRPEAAKVRALIEDWLGRYPQDHRLGLVQRLRSPINGTHRSAFLELLLHELFTRKGHRVIEVEPEVPGTTKNPDFLMSSPDGHLYYLEAVLAQGMSKAQLGAEKRLNSALQAIDTTPSPRHFLDLRSSGSPRSPVPINKLKRAVAEYVAQLPDGEAAKEAAPFHYTHDGLDIRLMAWPRNSNAGQTRSIGVRHFGAGNATRALGMKDAVEDKARKYGKVLNHPLVVAVAGNETFNYDDDALDALLGDETAEVFNGPDGKGAVRLARKPNGVWMGQQGPRKRVLSAVIWMKQIDPWNFAARVPIMVANPWATYAVPRLDVGLKEVRFIDQAVEEREGGTLGRALGLQDNWPED